MPLQRLRFDDLPKLAMEYSLPCSFLASSYWRSRTGCFWRAQASFSFSATSSARVVFQIFQFVLYMSRLSCVSLISFYVCKPFYFSASSAFEPYSTLYYKLGTNAIVKRFLRPFFVRFLPERSIISQFPSLFEAADRFPTSERKSSVSAHRSASPQCPAQCRHLQGFFPWA